jgi:subtilisin family serine protease
MRRLLRMSDDEILEAVEAYETRLNVKIQGIERLAEILSPTATDEDRQAVRRLKGLYRDQLLPHPLFGALVIEKITPVIKSRAIVHFTGNRDDLAALGLEVSAQAHDIFTVVGTTAQLADLAAQQATLYIRTPRLLLSHVEDAAAQAEITAVHQPRPVNPTGFQGQGVIVGIIDSALDVTHHGFREPTGNHDTRVLYYWVQDPYTLHPVTGQPVPQANPPGQTPQQFHNANPGTTPNFTGLNYGRIYTEGDINTALGLAGGPYGTGANEICCQPTMAEHGTHVAGIAAGNGHENNWATAPTHIGAAPQATIIHVRYRWSHANAQSGVFEDDVINAIDFIFRAAQFHNNMPAVVNVSLGTNLGPHNGASEFDQGRDNLLNSFQNRSIVWSAGNDNDDNGFRQGTIAAGITETLTLTPGSAAGRTQWLDIWYTGPQLDFEVQCGGSTSGWHAPGTEYHSTLNGYDVDVDRDVESGSGLRSIRIYIQDARSTDPWTVRLRNPDASLAVGYYAWTGLQGWWGSLNSATQDELTLSDTGCARSILTVGACQKRHPPNPASAENITDYSGAGPTVDGRIKPEIVAVGGRSGDQVISANSNQASGYIGMQGTSMSAPLVAGAVALLFEEYSTLGHDLNQDTIKALLAQHANSQPADDRNLYGYGRLRMIGPIDHIRPPVNVDLWMRTADDDYGEEPYPGGCFCGAPDIRVFAAGTTNEVTQLHWGTTYDARVTVRNLGDSDAVNATVQLKYTLPWAAPNDWTPAEDASDQPLQQTTTVPALDQVELTFQWRPESGEISGTPAGATHFCLLAEVDHPLDPLAFSAPTTSGGSAWSTNIKGTNNVALRNVHIQ